MARPPIGPTAMKYTVKFRLTKEEFAMLKKIARNGAVSAALRQLIHDESDRRKGGRGG